MKRDQFSNFGKLDANIEELIQKVQQHQDMANEPALRMTDDIRRAYRVEADEDARSLGRVLLRLVDDGAALESQAICVLQVNQWQERMPIMQQTTEMPSSDKTKKTLAKRLDLLVAMLCLLVLVGSFLAMLVIARTNGQASNKTNVGSHRKATPTAQGTLPVPSKQVIYSTNSAAKIIDSVGISASVDHGLAPTMINQFTVGQTIYLVCGVNNISRETGTITIKWYANDHFYRQDKVNIMKGNQSVLATFSTAYELPAEGKAEIYWNNQLAATVLFVVEPLSR